MSYKYSESFVVLLLLGNSSSIRVLPKGLYGKMSFLIDPKPSMMFHRAAQVSWDQLSPHSKHYYRSVFWQLKRGILDITSNMLDVIYGKTIMSLMTGSNDHFSHNQ